MKTKKFLSAILCIAMVLGTMSFMVFADDAVVAKIGETGYNSITEALKAAIEMEGDVTVTLTEDMDLSEYTSVTMAPISGEPRITSLTIDGGENRTEITNLAQPLMIISGSSGYESYDLVVKNIDFENVNVMGNSGCGLIGAGVITAATKAAQNVTIENVSVKGGTITSDDFAGAFLGYFQGFYTDTKLVIKNCEVSGLTIKSETKGGAVGGLVGHVDNGTISVDNTVVGKEMTLVSYEESEYNEHKTGMAFGTLLNGSKASVNLTVKENAKINEEKTLEKILGRIGKDCSLVITGGEYISRPDIIGTEKDSLTDICPVSDASTENVKLADGYKLTEDNGKFVVTDSLARSLTVAVDEKTASVDDEIIAKVVVNGNGMTFADWTFEYDTNVFSCTEGTDGKIEGNSYSGSTPYNDGEIIKTYTLKVKAQENNETVTTLKFSDDSVVGNDDDSIAVGLQRKTELVSDTVTIMFKDFDTIKTMVDGVEETTSLKTIPYDTKNHTFEVVSEADANVTYTVEKDGQVVDISVDEIKDMGTYVIKYTITKKGYNDKSGEFTIIIIQPDNEIELVPNFVKGKVAILVYTNIDDISYQYDNNLMVDVTAKYSKAGYKRVFGYVTEPLKDGDKVTLEKAKYAEKLLAEVPENEALVTITKIDYNLAEDDIVNYLDVNAGYGVYNARTAYFNVNAMKIVFKADVNSDKAVSFEDAEAVYNEVYKSAK